MKPGRKKLITALFFLVGLILLLLWLQGVFRHRVGPGTVSLTAAELAQGRYQVAWQKVWDWQEAPGVVASAQQPQVAAQVMGRILKILVAPGDQVQAGQVLAVLDDAELRSRLGQAQEQVAALQAQLQQARSDYQRFSAVLERRVVPRRDFDQVKARFESLQAQVQQAQQAVREAQANFRYGKVVSPANGLVAEKSADVGDLATPGRPLFTIFNPQQMRLDAQVGEQYSPWLQVGTPVRVLIPSLSWKVDTVLEEVVAQAASDSRTVLVKARLPWHQDLRPGLFGRLYFAGRSREALLIPTAAVKHLGQLETVTVLTPTGLQNRQVRLGKEYEEQVEVLAGLQAGEEILLPAKQLP
ncbi:MAG: efflux RND transporter periplasmic adaptor subunit [Desulfobacca sp.]|uniref:efflux RND transporter periplasmic adaptor subunit n=1 Tax=Desulfobacca sp. TaxID=2067990 RepID=UPI00404B5D5F